MGSSHITFPQIEITTTINSGVAGLRYNSVSLQFLIRVDFLHSIVVRLGYGGNGVYTQNGG